MKTLEEYEASAHSSIIKAFSDYGGNLIATTSFGIQSAIILNLISRVCPEIPIIFIDTGYLFNETYLYKESLDSLLDLNLHLYSPRMSSRMMEAIHGKLWEQEKTLDSYNDIVKVEPMNRAIREFDAKAWISGLRNEQSKSRKSLTSEESQNGLVKIYPIIDWSNDIVEMYFEKYNLPRHPLRHKGYKTVGDYHSSKPNGGEETRFNGIKRECGLHERVSADYQI